jgi:sulfotransferase
MNELHFCGGMPRSGSTILMNILQQNPQIFTTGTCALADLIGTHILVKSRYREQFQAMSTEQADKAMYGLIHGATKGWFESLTKKPVVISKNRNWSTLFHLYPNSKYIVMVRDLRDVIESFEKVNDRTLALHSFGDRTVMTTAMHIHEKFRYYFNESNSVSETLNYEVPRLMEWFKKDSSKVLFIRYEDFTKEPIYILRKVYNFIGKEYFEHNLDHIEQSELFEHDHAYFREKTDHVTQSRFQMYKEPQRKLSIEFHDRVVKENLWYYNAFYPEVLNEGKSV